MAKKEARSRRKRMQRPRLRGINILRKKADLVKRAQIAIEERQTGPSPIERKRVRITRLLPRRWSALKKERRKTGRQATKIIPINRPLGGKIQ